MSEQGKQPDNGELAARLWLASQIKQAGGLEVQAGRFAEEDDLEKPEKKIEKRESFRPFSEESASTASALHPNRNEDGILADLERLDYEKTKPVKIAGDNSNIEHLTLEECSERELANAAAVKRKGIFGIVDGISGQHSTGTGHVAARIVTAELAERMARLPDDADAENTVTEMVEAFKSASRKIRSHKKWQDNSKDYYGSTATLVRIIRKPEGGADIALAHIGDSRAYILKKDGRMIRLTDDDSYALEAHRVEQGLPTIHDTKKIKKLEGARFPISREDYEAIINTEDPKKLPRDLRPYFENRNVVFSAIDSDMDPSRIQTKVVSVEKGDKLILITDGVGDVMTDEQIAEEAQLGAQNLVFAARAKYDDFSNERRKMPDDISADIIEID